MKVFHIVSEQHPADVARYACALCSALKQSGYGCTIFADSKLKNFEQLKAEGTEVVATKLGTFARTFSAPIALSKAIANADADVAIHTYNFDDAYLAQRAKALYKGSHKIKIVCSIFHAEPAPDKRIHSLITDEIDALLFRTEKEKDIYQSGAATGRERIHVAGMGAADLQISEASDGPARLLFVGELTPESNFRSIIEALGELAELDWTLEVCGEGKGNYVMPCVRIARDCGINKRINWLGEANAASLINQANIGLLPTPAQALEFMSAGLAVVDTCSASELASHLRELISDTKKRKARGQEARETYEKHYRIEQHAQKITSIYNEN